jgi:hypothetical protein
MCCVVCCLFFPLRQQLATKNLDLPTMELLLKEDADVAAAGEPWFRYQ